MQHFSFKKNWSLDKSSCRMCCITHLLDPGFVSETTAQVHKAKLVNNCCSKAIPWGKEKRKNKQKNVKMLSSNDKNSIYNFETTMRFIQIKTHTVRQTKQRKTTENPFPCRSPDYPFPFFKKKGNMIHNCKCSFSVLEEYTEAHF